MKALLGRYECAVKTVSRWYQGTRRGIRQVYGGGHVSEHLKAHLHIGVPSLCVLRCPNCHMLLVMFMYAARHVSEHPDPHTHTCVPSLCLVYQPLRCWFLYTCVYDALS